MPARRKRGDSWKESGRWGWSGREQLHFVWQLVLARHDCCHLRSALTPHPTHPSPLPPLQPSLSPYGPSTVPAPKPSAGGTANVRRPPTVMPSMPRCRPSHTPGTGAPPRRMMAGRSTPMPPSRYVCQQQWWQARRAGGRWGTAGRCRVRPVWACSATKQCSGACGVQGQGSAVPSGGWWVPGRGPHRAAERRVEQRTVGGAGALVMNLPGQEENDVISTL